MAGWYYSVIGLHTGSSCSGGTGSYRAAAPRHYHTCPSGDYVTEWMNDNLFISAVSVQHKRKRSDWNTKEVLLKWPVKHRQHQNGPEHRIFPSYSFPHSPFVVFAFTCDEQGKEWSANATVSLCIRSDFKSFPGCCRRYVWSDFFLSHSIFSSYLFDICRFLIVCDEWGQGMVRQWEYVIMGLVLEGMPRPCRRKVWNGFFISHSIFLSYLFDSGRFLLVYG